MAFQIIQNQTGYVNPEVAALNTGWTISKIYAVHTSCDAGIIKSQGALGLQVGHTYNITYTIDNLTSGQVYVIAGAANGTSRTTNGTFTETIICTDIAQLSFYSDGSLRISGLKFADESEGTISGTTVVFNEKENKWTGEYSAIPELMIKFIDDIFFMKNGQLWKQNSNDIYNNFFGEQFSSKITFVVNVDYKKDKLWYNIRLDAKGNWYAPSLLISPTNQFPNGMTSRLKKNNFKLVDGKLWAAILRDLNDPNFASVMNTSDVLYNARIMQGGWLIIEMQCDDDTASEISSMEVYYTEVERSV